MKRLLTALGVIALLVVATAILVQGRALASPLPGAVFTTDPSGQVVDGDIYQQKCQVSLNGGGHSHHLPDGIYDVAVPTVTPRVVPPNSGTGGTETENLGTGQMTFMGIIGVLTLLEVGAILFWLGWLYYSRPPRD